jgi:hypothetical protein
MVMSSATRRRERLRRWGPGATVTSSERAPRINKPKLSKDNYKNKKNWSRVSDGSLTPRQTGQLTVGHNITLTWAIQSEPRVQRGSVGRQTSPSLRLLWNNSPWWRRGSPIIVSLSVTTPSYLWDKRQPARTWSRGIRKLRELRCLKPLQDNWRRHSWLRRISACCNEL